jgi:hypothetical protein
MFSKQLVGLVGLGLFAVACSSAPAGDATDSATGAASSGCEATSKTACTPAPGSQLRTGIADLLRFSIKSDLAKNGVEPADADIKFVFKTMLIQNEHISIAAKIMKGDGTTNFDMTGTKFEGRPNTVQSLLEVESGSEFSHAIGISLEQKQFACNFVEAHFDGQAPGMYQGDMKADCDASKKVDDACFVGYSHGASQCNTTAGGDDAKFDKCLAKVKSDVAGCCVDGSAACLDL